VGRARTVFYERRLGHPAENRASILPSPIAGEPLALELVRVPVKAQASQQLEWPSLLAPRAGCS